MLLEKFIPCSFSDHLKDQFLNLELVYMCLGFLIFLGMLHIFFGSSISEFDVLYED